jgi:hypothetical protein
MSSVGLSNSQRGSSRRRFPKQARPIKKRPPEGGRRLFPLSNRTGRDYITDAAKFDTVAMPLGEVTVIVTMPLPGADPAVRNDV